MQWNTYLSAFFTPDHNAPVTGGIKRNEPIGGDAYGMPRNASTGSKCLPSKWTMTPDTEPYLVWTMRDVNLLPSGPVCEPAPLLPLLPPLPPDDIGNNIGSSTMANISIIGWLVGLRQRWWRTHWATGPDQRE